MYCIKIVITMSIKDIIKNTMKPTLYAKGNSFMWTNKHISKQLLDIHLNKEIDLASRKESTIDSTINWILQQVPTTVLNILDLGCGPGLYCEKLQEKGHSVTGVDISSTSIEYAIKAASSNSQKIEYKNSNYLELDLPDKSYDLIIMIYTDFGVLLPDERDTILSKIYSALKPGGVFIFDVINDKDISSKVTPNNWEVTNNGFWSEQPYLLLSNSFIYAEHKVVLYQHNVVFENNDIETYRFWTHHFSKKDIVNIINKFGFSKVKSFTNIIPAVDNWSGDNVTFYTLMK